MQLLVWIITANLLGSIPFGIIITRSKTGKDIRNIGSGNIGATNVLRAAGKVAALVTLIADTLKGFLPVWLATKFLANPTSILMIASATLIGHCYPIFAQFRGGKGVATSLGIFLALSPLATLGSFLVWILFLLAFREVAIGSMAAAFSMPLILKGTGAYPELLIFSGLVLVFIVYRHEENLKQIFTKKLPKEL